MIAAKKIVSIAISVAVFVFLISTVKDESEGGITLLNSAKNHFSLLASEATTTRTGLAEGGSSGSSSNGGGAVSASSGSGGSGGSNSVEESSHGFIIAENEPIKVIDEEHEDSEWRISRSRLALALVMFGLSISLPFVVYGVLLSIEKKREGDVQQSFEPAVAEGEGRLVDQRYALARDMRELLSVPVGSVVFVQFLGMGMDLLSLPEYWGDIELNLLVAQITAALLILACLWTWWRVVDVAKMAIGRQGWVVRSKMFSLYSEAASKIGMVIKAFGAILVVLIVSVMWGNADDFSSQSALASLSVAALGSLAFVGNMFRGTLRQYKAGLDMIEENRFRTGDVIEIFGRAWGRVKGKVAYIESRFCILIGLDGKKIYVPTEYIPASAITNHSRSHPPVLLDVHVAVDTRHDALDQLIATLREVVVTHAAVVADSVSVGLRAFTPSSICVHISARIAPSASANVVHEDLMLLAIQAAQRSNITLAKPSPVPDLGLTSFSTQ